jgi:hypothetical protein
MGTWGLIMFEVKEGKAPMLVIFQLFKIKIKI